jgi:hypothetical protein
MKYNISFQERAKLGKELLSKQLPITLQDAKKQVEWLKQISTSKLKKQRT